jgi:hypothetical protein
MIKHTLTVEVTSDCPTVHTVVRNRCKVWRATGLDLHSSKLRRELIHNTASIQTVSVRNVIESESMNKQCVTQQQINIIFALITKLICCYSSFSTVMLYFLILQWVNLQVLCKLGWGVRLYGKTLFRKLTVNR